MGGETNRENWEHFYFSDASQAPVVQKVNSIFHQKASGGYWENQYYCTIQWIEVYRVGSAISTFLTTGARSLRYSHSQHMKTEICTVEDAGDGCNILAWAQFSS